jgi:cytochrome c oxidase cbb3-type subunit 3
MNAVSKREPAKVEVRAHSWDGIQEYNTPLPRWWLYVFLSTVVWAIGYWIVMPAWPMLSSYTKGVLGWSQRANVVRDLEALQKARRPREAQLAAQPLADIKRDPALMEFALASGRAAFKENCAPCHGAGAQGAVGYPNLNDDDWLWGGSLDAIETTITYGIRNDDRRSRFSEMPAFLRDGTLTSAQVDTLVSYVLSLSGKAIDPAVQSQGAKLFADNCASCHGETGTGDRAQGAPNLRDGIWLYGSTPKAIRQTIAYARNSSMPAWVDRLSPATIRAIAIYVHTLGGGEPETAQAAPQAAAAKAR